MSSCGLIGTALEQYDFVIPRARANRPAVVAFKALLHDASVVGKVFWTGALGRGSDVVQTLLHALERKEFVRRERRPSVEGEAEFRKNERSEREPARR